MAPRFQGQIQHTPYPMTTPQGVPFQHAPYPMAPPQGMQCGYAPEPERPIHVGPPTPEQLLASVNWAVHRETSYEVIRPLPFTVLHSYIYSGDHE